MIVASQVNFDIRISDIMHEVREFFNTAATVTQEFVFGRAGSMPPSQESLNHIEHLKDTL
jgi:hypothetical protein